MHPTQHFASDNYAGVCPEAMAAFAAANAGQGRGRECRAHQASVQAVRVFPSQQDLRGRASEHRQGSADRDGVAQADRPLGRTDTDAVISLAAKELRALVRVVPQGAEHRTRGGQEPVLAGGGGKLPEARSEDEPTLQVSADEAMVFQCDGEAVGRRPGQAGRRDQLRQG